jgi:hypothetical protein
MKLFNKIIVTVGICMATLGAFAQSSVSLPFIGQGNGTDSGLVPQGLSGYLQMFTNGTASRTFSYGDSTLTYVKGGFLGYAGMNYTNPVTGAVFTGTTNGALPIYTTNSAGFADVALWANRDGSAPIANVSARINGYDANFTNLVTFTFATINGGGHPVTTGTGSSVAFSMTGNGTNDVEIQTNLFTSAVLQGARGLRLLSVVSANANTNGNGQVVNLWLNGAKPGGQ